MKKQVAKQKEAKAEEPRSVFTWATELFCRSSSPTSRRPSSSSMACEKIPGVIFVWRCRNTGVFWSGVFDFLTFVDLLVGDFGSEFEFW